MEPTTLGALGGFFGALVMLGVPLLGFLLRLHSNVQKVLALVEGREAVDGDGVLERLRDVEERLRHVEAAVGRAAGVEYDQSDYFEAD